MKIDSLSNQLRWVILLLAITVILPTVCLLWFMSQAVKNVQLAARQELMAVYQEKLAKASQETNQQWSEHLERLDTLIDHSLPSDVFNNLFEAQEHSVIVYDENGRRVYPLISTDINAPAGLSEEFKDAWGLEFTEQEFGQAAKLYEEKAQSNNNYVRFSALIGWSRCLTKLGDMQQAIEACKKVAFSPEEETCDTATLMLIANARLLLVESVRSKPAEVERLIRCSFTEALSKLLAIIGEQNEAGAVLPLDQRIFLAHRVDEIMKSIEGVFSDELQSFSRDTFLLAHWEEAGQSAAQVLGDAGLSLPMAERFPTTTALQDWPIDQFRRLQLDEQTICYGLRHDVGGKTVLLVRPGRPGIPLGSRYEYNLMRTAGVVYRILDNLGRVVAGGGPHRGRPFMTLPVGGYFADWQVELYFSGDDIFEKTARKQIALYIWAGVLVIVLILAAGGFAGQAVGRQIRLNKLKNDFIATVSHELKTPLASMRVLADTLLEGNYQDQKQATEYLELICKENKRLSGLIDNFLTFSRMERNKQAVDMVRTSPAAIARAAAEAVRTEFSQSPCKFEVSIHEDLPDVLADHDAMVTVLVNLLDNAYKYSYDDKRIELNVFAEDGSVCFRVSDNGVGMSRRTLKKIFKRFYQVDRSLSRHAQGCGLGLSIAKFIVDAHKGSISIDSEPDKGSTFTVKLPAIS